MENLENNRTIAEFMGVKSVYNKYTNNSEDQGVLVFQYPINKTQIWNVTPEEMVYHSSFDWLMPVVEKIESLGGSVSIDDGGCYLHYPNELSTMESFSKEDYETKLNCVYNACVSFIKWHNLNK